MCGFSFQLQYLVGGGGGFFLVFAASLLLSRFLKLSTAMRVSGPKQAGQLARQSARRLRRDLSKSRVKRNDVWNGLTTSPSDGVG